MVPGVSLHLWNIKFVENRPRIIISMKSEVAYLGRKGYITQFVRIFGYTILLCLGWTKTNINQNSKIGSVEQNNESIFLGYQNEISGCTEQLRKSQVCCWKIAILLSYVQDVVNSTTTTFPYCPYNPYWELSVQWHSPCESRRVSLLLWFEVCEGKTYRNRLKKWSKNVRVYYRNLPRKHNTLSSYSPSLKICLMVLLGHASFWGCGPVAITS